MATRAASASGPQSGSSIWAGEMRYVARQPVLNLRGRVHGYELLFREAPETGASRDADTAARTMLDNAVIFGLEWLTNGLPAFVHCTTEALTEQLVLVLAPRTTVLAIPANLEVTPRLMDACRELKTRGFRLCLDDFSWKPELRPLAELADYIRVDFTRVGVKERQYLRRLTCDPIALVAKKVATQEQYGQACAEGFTLFQGDYFCHPVLLRKRKVPSNWQSHFEIVRELYHDPMDIKKVSRLVLRDASLTYRLLRLVNSPVYAIQQEVRSVDAAIIAVGEDTFRRIVNVAVLSELNSDHPPEILQMALTRGKFCSLAAELYGLDPNEQYLVGMLSLLPAMLRIPMEELAPSLPLRSEVCEALQGTGNLERCLLTWLEALERADWASCDRMILAHGASREQFMRCYAEAVAWAQAALKSSS